MEAVKSNSTEQYSKKCIRIYQLPLANRILNVVVSLCFTAFAVALICLQISYAWLFLIFVIAFSVGLYFGTFQTYISIEPDKNLLIIKEPPGYKAKKIDLIYVKKLVFSDGIREKTHFTVDIVCKGFTEKISSWNFISPYNSFVLFNVYNRQKKRLEKFIAQANDLLERRAEDGFVS